MRKTLLVAVVLAAALLMVPGSASAADTALKASLTGEKERPGPGDRNGHGFAAIILDDSADQVCFALSWNRIRTPVAAHIHVGKRNEAGPIVVGLFMGTPRKAACVDAPSSLIEQIEDKPKNYYVNIHTPDFPNGAIRGQLKRAD